MKNFVLIIALAFLSSTAFGQKVNFSGEWNGQEYESKQHFTLNEEVCENTGSVEGSDYTLTQTFSMKEDNMVVASEAASDMGELFETFVFEKK